MSGHGAPIPDRPDRPLVVKCGYDGTSRRITFPSAATCRYESLRLRIEECFFLSASAFALSYVDDDGEEFFIRSEEDLTEAIAYFVSGDDEGNVSMYSGHSANRIGMGIGPSTQKISIRVEIILEYDGPSLSDASSISSFQTDSVDGGGTVYESSWRSSGYSDSIRSGRSRTTGENRTPGGIRIGGRNPAQSPPTRNVEQDMETMTLSTSPESTDTLEPRRRSSLNSHGKSSRSSGRRSSGNTAVPIVRTPLTGPESDPAPSLLTHSELGSRWLREQSKLATTRRMIYPRSGSSRRYDSDEESADSGEDSIGDLALVRDAKGKFYYSYQNGDDISLSSTTDMYDDGIGHYPVSFAGSMVSASATPSANGMSESSSAIDYGARPIIAPDCSACGVRLDYMRYVCQTCGEGEMWKDNASGKAPFVPPRVPSESSISDGSGSTEPGRQLSNGSMTEYAMDMSRDRRSSTSTNASRGSLTSPRHSEELEEEGQRRLRPDERLPAGYELCVGCIELHGVAHSKAAARQAKTRPARPVSGRKRRAGELRHTYREKIWGPSGWQDVEYTEDSQCTICQGRLYSDAYKCVTCAKFDLCKECHVKVEDIHPAHAFLSIPDKVLPPAGLAVSPESAISSTETTRRPVRHPGAFCHNCLQDIVGPRFHCAVCPSWDLCIQCEGLGGVGNASGHTPDHIMMKIPIPLATNEVEAVSRRARDRWFHQDSNAVAAAASNATPTVSSRSSSPTNETIYAMETRRNGHASVATPPRSNMMNGDELDHGLHCNNCNEWIMGRRYQCANCPSDPEGYNLCSICELRSYRVHNPTHVFFRFDRPVHFPLRSQRPLLPILYRSRVGEIPSGTVINPRDPVAYLKHVLHRETLCDIHSDQIRGIWLRCAHCAAGFDICQEAEQIADHDPTHVFVVFKARVNMEVFRDVADLAAAHSKPLLRERVYVD